MVDLHDEIAGKLRGVGQRYTANRRVIIDVLEAATHPLTIQESLDRRTTLAQSSAYRNLAVLEETGVVHRVVSSDEFARYELAEDLTEHHHHHLICRSCGAVADFTVAPEVELVLAGALEQAAGDHGFSAEDHRLDLVGRCRRCR